ncbi:unnamed protein product, partial [Prorocentrum cordatum]
APSAASSAGVSALPRLPMISPTSRDDSPEPVPLPAAAAAALGWRLELAGESATVVLCSEGREELFQHAVSRLRRFARAGADEPREIEDLGCLIAVLRSYQRLFGDGGVAPLSEPGWPLLMHAAAFPGLTGQPQIDEKAVVCDLSANLSENAELPLPRLWSNEAPAELLDGHRAICSVPRPTSLSGMSQRQGVAELVAKLRARAREAHPAGPPAPFPCADIEAALLCAPSDVE